MSTITSILASLVALFELVSSAVKKARIAREEAAIKENAFGWISKNYSSGNASSDDGVHDDADGSNTEAKS